MYDTPPTLPTPSLLRMTCIYMQIHVMEGALVCPHCSRNYPISNGIPNMMLQEDEL
jgi:multifunctional methyltransferase subunit TRM112